MIRSFGPAVYHGEDGSLRPSCLWCVFRIGGACTHVKPSREIPDTDNTPDWCEMREGMLRDAADAVAQPGGGAA